MSFGKTLKRVMDERGLKSVDLADEMVSVQYISKLMNDRVKSPTWDKALNIIEKLGMTPSEFRSIEIEIEYDSQAHKRKAR
ncbi:helix-turn-helix domain-containing protein [Collinsella aerofaciens]|uniref:helix-turn-helix domain-containing protein n=1 Tax=Collinsella aerofaciens TaxID=74426 RepID=UPI00325C27A7